jgi:hypothetical protein
MITKSSALVIAIIFMVTMMPLFTPVAVAQEATATLQITCNPDCIMALVIISPADVSEFQVSIKATNTVALDTEQASLTGFMAGATLFPILEGPILTEYRWVSFTSPGGTVGTLSVPISALQAGETVVLDKADLLDENGETIESITIGIDGQVITTIRITSTSTATSLITTTTTTTATTTATTRLTSTQVSTVTTTTTTTAGLSTITQTVTSTNTAVTTQATTVTSGATTTILTTTQTNTETVVIEEEEEGSAFGIYAIVLAVIAIILLGLAVLRQQREDLFTQLRDMLPF